MQVTQYANLHFYHYRDNSLDLFNKIYSRIGGTMIEITLFGTKKNLNFYYANLKARLKEKLRIVESTSTSDYSGQVIISIKYDDLCISTIKVDGFNNIGLKALVTLEPFFIQYRKAIGSDDVTIITKNKGLTDKLDDYEELETYERRLYSC